MCHSHLRTNKNNTMQPYSLIWVVLLKTFHSFQHDEVKMKSLFLSGKSVSVGHVKNVSVVLGLNGPYLCFIPGNLGVSSFGYLAVLFLHISLHLRDHGKERLVGMIKLQIFHYFFIRQFLILKIDSKISFYFNSHFCLFSLLENKHVNCY